MIEDEVVKRMKTKYNRVNSLLFNRSVEYAKSPGNLYDILESIPNEPPVIWSSELRRWVNSDDLTQASEFEFPNESE